MNKTLEFEQWNRGLKPSLDSDSTSFVSVQGTAVSDQFAVLKLSFDLHTERFDRQKGPFVYDCRTLGLKADG